MANLGDLCRQIRPKLQQSKLLDDQIQYAKQYEQRKRQLQQVVFQLQALSTKACLLQQHHRLRLSFASLARASQETKELATHYANDQKAILAISDQFFVGWQQVINEFSTGLDQAWNDFKESAIFSVKTVELELAALLKDYFTAVHRIRNMQNELQLLVSTLPATEQTWERLLALNTQVEGEWKALRMDHLPDNVVRFIKKAKLEGASLDDCTLEIQQWLEERGQKHNFRIKLIG